MLERVLLSESRRLNNLATSRALRDARLHYQSQIDNLTEEQGRILEDFRVLVSVCAELNETAR